MKANVSEYEFRDTILRLRPDNFSYQGLTELYEYILDYEESTGIETEFDPIAICCEFSEYESVTECLKEFALDTIEELEEHTAVIMVHDPFSESEEPRIIIQDF